MIGYFTEISGCLAVAKYGHTVHTHTAHWYISTVHTHIIHAHTDVFKQYCTITCLQAFQLNVKSLQLLLFNLLSHLLTFTLQRLLLYTYAFHYMFTLLPFLFANITVCTVIGMT